MRDFLLMVGGVILAGCGGSSDALDCAHGVSGATIRHGMCKVAATGSGTFACGTPVGIFCGDEANCPTDWSLSCEGSGAMGSNCTYGTASFTMPDAMTCVYDGIETRNGVDGMATVDINGRCTYEPCQP